MRKQFSLLPIFYILIMTATMAVTLMAGEPVAKIHCNMQGCAGKDTLRLYRFEGMGFAKLDEKPSKKGMVTFEVPFGEPAFYYIGTEPQQVRTVIAGKEKEFTVLMNCTDINASNITGSPYNTSYERIKMQILEFGKETNQLNQEYGPQLSDQSKVTEFKGKLSILDTRKIKFLDSIKKADRFLGSIVALNTLPSFFTNGNNYESELDYFVYEYFGKADLKDSIYEYSPWIYESVQSYVSTLINARVPDEQMRTFLHSLMNKMPQFTHTKKMALASMVKTLQARNHPSWQYFGNLYINFYKKSYPAEMVELERIFADLKKFDVGGEAPNFTQPNVEGKNVSLHDLRGKVLLVDFWASWCGPCRRDMPHVKELYAKYKDKGFEVLGVSLDRTKDAWVGAIEKDGLPWLHVSDVLGWQNAAAQLYSVQSIPHTMLLDKKGIILARGLRGDALSAKLQEIFGF